MYMMAVASTNGKAETPISDDFRNGGRFYAPIWGSTLLPTLTYT